MKRYSTVCEKEVDMKKQTSWRVVIGALILAGLPLSAAQAAEITVDETTCTLADAISTANDGTLHGGCVVGDIGADIIIMEEDVTLAAALPYINSTITIEGGDHFISGNNDSAVGSVLQVSSSGDLTLNDTTVRDGLSATGYGGGIDNFGTVTLNNSIVSGNSTSSSSLGGGGGIFNYGTLTLNSSTVSDNSASSTGYASSYGGGIANAGTVTLNSSTVSGNSASASSGSTYGGGIYNEGTVTLTDSTVSDNSASSQGGGIFNMSTGTVTLDSSVVSGNAVSSVGASYGGGIVSGGTLMLTDSTVTANSAVSTSSDSTSMAGGGGMYCGGTVTLTNSTVSGNSASSTSSGSSTTTISAGGGIVGSGTLTLINSTVSGNSASSTNTSAATVSSLGGGIYGGTVTLINSTVSGNSVATTASSAATINLSSGGGIYGTTTLTLQSSVISGNSASGSGNEISVGSTITADSYNLFGHSGETGAEAFGGFTPGTNDVNATSDGTNPTALSDILSPLTDNGGLTMTHALVPGSPAIDLDPSCSTGLTTDQRGLPRPDGDGCDAGSFEWRNTPPVADAGPDHIGVEGDTVCFDGSGSTDADGDELEYSWSLDTWPEGSTAELDDPTAEITCLVADLPGTYTVSLVVNDGAEDSDPDTAVAAVGVSDHQAVIMTLEELLENVKALSPTTRRGKLIKKALRLEIWRAIRMVKQGLYADALVQLRSTLSKMDGCAATGEPDRNDWIRDCENQAQLYPLVQEAIEYLESMI